MTQKQLELAAKHGTPSEFADGVWRAYNDGYLGSEEGSAAAAQKAIDEYRREWFLAGQG